eukprot:gnl/MRDRNA2_/MRDRNA2_35243_c0_seq2.p1 gnl/MRDRNA2_/MRDRNA2_35243_c0~~gnl/MRDRNA2_/MRDRNA2_35243_c0_seq2.p1  ORF type:complete len:258 (-),score=41.82 gnl/MRDRNA2_/MRDRNA2_35243_c0_seq2:33-806(-)
MLFLLTLATLPCYAAAGLIKVRQTGCEKTYETFSNKLKMCNAETKEMEEQAGEDLDKLQARIDYNDCRIKELNAEWQTVSDDFRKDNPYLEPSFMLKATKRKKGNLRPRHPRSLLVGTSNSSLSQQPSNDHILSATEQSPPPVDDPVNDDYYYGDQGPVKDPECACFLDDHCECVAGCRNLCDHCKVQYKGTKDRLYQQWQDKQARIKRQEGHIYSLEENIRRSRIEDPQKDYDRDGARMKDKYRVSECGGETHVVR